MTILQDIQKGRIPARLTVDDLYALTEAGVFAENENIELIEGEIVPMAASKASVHEQMKSMLTRALVFALPESARLFVEPTLTLSGDTALEPDLAVWRKGGLSREMRGPDMLLIIEVADSSLGYDLKTKARLYAQHGVREYCVVDATRKEVRVHKAPAGDGYADVTEFAAHEPVTASLLQGVTIQLDQLD
jgi:Uma2 family endonuclease